MCDKQVWARYPQCSGAFGVMQEFSFTRIKEGKAHSISRGSLSQDDEEVLREQRWPFTSSRAKVCLGFCAPLALGESNSPGRPGAPKAFGSFGTNAACQEQSFLGR